MPGATAPATGAPARRGSRTTGRLGPARTRASASPTSQSAAAAARSATMTANGLSSRCLRERSAATAPGSPSISTSTPRASLPTNPASPSRLASAWTNGRNPTPCTIPSTRSLTRTHPGLVVVMGASSSRARVRVRPPRPRPSVAGPAPPARAASQSYRPPRTPDRSRSGTHRLSNFALLRGSLGVRGNPAVLLVFRYCQFIVTFWHFARQWLPQRPCEVERVSLTGVPVVPVVPERGANP